MGSSPLTRGKPTVTFRGDTTPGLIPAHAGKTAAPTPPVPGRRAHPRSRGENSRLSSSGSKRTGSSPLTRGKRSRRRKGRNLRGIIPAHAGKTAASACLVTPTGDHPRSRGENSRTVTMASREAGSSPLTRGKLGHGRLRSVKSGIIPAHAGKTRRQPRRTEPHRDHPRSRGENPTVPVRAGPVAGSSPLTRGKLGRATRNRGRCGLIPAHAGKTVAPRATGILRRAHPRSRGENLERTMT